MTRAAPWVATVMLPAAVPLPRQHALADLLRVRVPVAEVGR